VSLKLYPWLELVRQPYFASWPGRVRRRGRVWRVCGTIVSGPGGGGSRDRPGPVPGPAATTPGTGTSRWPCWPTPTWPSRRRPPQKPWQRPHPGHARRGPPSPGTLASFPILPISLPGTRRSPLPDNLWSTNLMALRRRAQWNCQRRILQPPSRYRPERIHDVEIRMGIRRLLATA
jgi:hypothetical protein